MNEEKKKDKEKPNSFSMKGIILPKKSPNKKRIKNILLEKKNDFSQEYFNLLNISISLPCYVKTNFEYNYGHLTLNNNKLSVIGVDNELNNNKFDENTNNTNVKRDKNLYPLFFIDFNLITCELIIHKTKPKFRLIILGKNMDNEDFDNENDYILKYNVIKFKLSDYQNSNFNSLCEKINKSIILSNGYRKNIFSINLRKNFGTEYFMYYKEFASKGNTGDIVLFRGYSSESKLQRAITGAEYDHVAILIKDKGKLKVFESTGKEGVKVRPWLDFIIYLWYLLYDKMVFRKLKVTEERMKNYIMDINKEELKSNLPYDYKTLEEKFYYYLNSRVNDFLTCSAQKDYKFSGYGFFCQSKMKDNFKDRSGFSCSELVAACYYHSGIISEQLEASNYLPGTFSRSGKVPFKSGFSLGEEYIIDFSSVPKES